MSVLANWEGVEAVGALRAIRAASVVRQKGEAQDALAGVLLTDGLAVATDSYCLITVPLAYEGPDFVMPSSVLDRLEKIKITAHIYPCRLEISESEQMINVQWFSGTMTEVFNAEKIVRSFPNWRSLTISPEDYEISSPKPVLLKIALLNRVAKVASELGDRDAEIELQHVVDSYKVTVWSIKTGGYGDVMWMQMPAWARGGR
jgi:hypothetical protein